MIPKSNTDSKILQFYFNKPFANPVMKLQKLKICGFLIADIYHFVKNVAELFQHPKIPNVLYANLKLLLGLVSNCDLEIRKLIMLHFQPFMLYLVFFLLNYYVYALNFNKTKKYLYFCTYLLKSKYFMGKIYTFFKNFLNNISRLIQCFLNYALNIYLYKNIC